MRNQLHPEPPSRPPRARALAAAALLSGALLAGCGATSSGTTARTGGAARTPASNGGSATTTRAVRASGPLAFAECMRAHGVPSFPDPTPSGGPSPFTIGDSAAAPAFKAAQAKCEKLVPGSSPLPGAGTQTHPSAQTLAKLVRIARCMRRHGVSQFPDPQTSMPPASTLGPGGEYNVITDFDGAILAWPATLNLQAPAYRQALTACGAPPLGLPH